MTFFAFLKTISRNVKHFTFQFRLKAQGMLNTRLFHQTACTSSGQKYPTNTTMVYSLVFILHTVPSALTVKDGLHVLVYLIEVLLSLALIPEPGMTLKLLELHQEELEKKGIWKSQCVSID